MINKRILHIFYMTSPSDKNCYWLRISAVGTGKFTFLNDVISSGGMDSLQSNTFFETVISRRPSQYVTIDRQHHRVIIISIQYEFHTEQLWIQLLFVVLKRLWLAIATSFSLIHEYAFSTTRSKISMRGRENVNPSDLTGYFIIFGDFPKQAFEVSNFANPSWKIWV